VVYLADTNHIVLNKERAIMESMESSNDKTKLKIEQYNRCCEDIRHYDSGVWQIASINITVAGIMIGIAFQYLTGVYRVFPLLLALGLSLTLTVTSSKYIFFQLGRAQFMKTIEEEYKIPSVPTKSQDIKDFLDSGKVKLDAPARWFIGRKANRWFVGMMLFVTALLGLLIVVSLLFPYQTSSITRLMPIHHK